MKSSQSITKKKVSVVIPSLNAKSFIGDCLNSLRSQTYRNFETIVVENGSTDGSAEYLAKNHPEVIVLQQPKNLGFAGGVNVGIKYSDAEYVVLLNNDASVHKDWLKYLVEAAENNSRAGSVTSKILQVHKKRGTNKHFIDTTGDYYSIWGLPFPRGRDELDIGQFEEADEVFAACGGSVLLRRATLNEVGLFDEKFFAYYEDVDLSFRMRLAGWVVIYEPKSIVYHALSKTSGGGRKPFARYHSIKNTWLLYLKNLPFTLLIRFLPRFIIMSLFMLVSSARNHLLRAHLKGMVMALFYTPSALLDRWRIQKNRVITPADVDAVLFKSLPPKQEEVFKKMKFKNANGR